MVFSELLRAVSMVMNDGPWREEKVELSHSSLMKLCRLSKLGSFLYFSAQQRPSIVDAQPL